jgi:hypothetical protein
MGKRATAASKELDNNNVKCIKFAIKIMQFQVMPFQTYAILKHKEVTEITFLKTYTFFFFAGIKVQ